MKNPSPADAEARLPQCRVCYTSGLEGSRSRVVVSDDARDQRLDLDADPLSDASSAMMQVTDIKVDQPLDDSSV